MGCDLREVCLLCIDKVLNNLFLLIFRKLVEFGLISQNVLFSVLILRLSLFRELFNFLFFVSGSAIEIINSLIPRNLLKEEGTSDEHDDSEDDLEVSTS